MCGIVGVYHYRDHEPVDQGLISEMTSIIRHRGPDDEGFYVGGDIALGMRRLSIIDLMSGHQPIHNETGDIWIVFNGEIYNFPQLRRELEGQGHVFYTHSDTEVIVHSYEQWGDDCFLHLNGIFGLAIWDEKKRRLLITRDHFGVKPLYFYDDGEHLLFASEIKALLLHPKVERAISEIGLEQALTFGFIPSPFTLFRGVRRLAPGHRIVVENSRMRLERYWHPIPQVIHPYSEKELIDDIRMRMEMAVARQMISDVPVGALLSGGTDSTAVVTLMTKHSQRVRTFTIGVRDTPEISELVAARATAQRLGTEHEEIEISAKEYMDFLPLAHWYLEEPCTMSALLTYFVCKLAQRSVKVVLTGQGGDEPFAGYRRYRGEYWGAYYRYLPDFIRDKVVSKLVHYLTDQLHWRRGVYALQEHQPLKRFHRIYEVFSSHDRLLLYHPPDDKGFNERDFSDFYDPIAYWMRGLEGLDSLDQLLYIDARLMLADNLLIFGDKMAMAASVEARVPLLDLELMQFVENIPARLKIKWGKPKYLYKKVLSAWLPAEILNRPKLGFQTPKEEWFRADMFDFLVDVLLSRNSLSSEILNRHEIERILNTHRHGQRNLWRQIFSLLSVELLNQTLIKGFEHYKALALSVAR